MSTKTWVVCLATGLVLCLIVAGLYGALRPVEHTAKIVELSDRNDTTQPIEKVHVSFHVVDGKKQTPIPRASIIGMRLCDGYCDDTIDDSVIENESLYFFGETDENGTFTVLLVAATYYISVYAENYMPESLRLFVSDTNSSLSVEISLNPLPEPDARVVGRVLNQSDGSPLSNVSVYAFSELLGDEGLYYPMETMAVTNDEGHYEVRVYSGVLVLHAYADGYYGYTTTVNVPPNTTMHIDIALIPFEGPPEAVSKVQGKVIAENGAGIAGAFVEFVCYSGRDRIGWINDTGYPSAWRYSGVSDAEGNYAVDVPAGWLSVIVHAEGYCTHYQELFVEANTVMWLNITLEKLPEPDAWISGIVRNTEGQTVAGAHVSAYALREFMDFILGPLPLNGTLIENITYGYYAASTVTDKNGKFTLALPAGQYVLLAFHEAHGGYYARVEVEPGATLYVEITLTPMLSNTIMPDKGNQSYVISPPKDITIAPKFIGTGEITLSPGSEIRIHISTLFEVPQGRRIMFSVRETNYISAIYNSVTGELLLRAPENWYGEEVVTVEATDGLTTVIGTILVKICSSSSQSNIALWFVCGVLVAAAVIGAVWYTQRNGKRGQKQKF